MATLDDLLDGGELEEFEPQLDPGEQAHRMVALDPSAHRWCFSSEQLGFASPARGMDAQVRAVLTDYCAGKLLLQGALVRQLRPPTDWVWEFKTAQPDAVRIFGWVYRPSAFIACLCRFKREVSRDCTEEREFVKAYRARLPLNEPKVCMGKNHDELFGSV